MTSFARIFPLTPIDLFYCVEYSDYSEIRNYVIIFEDNIGKRREKS